QAFGKILPPTIFGSCPPEGCTNVGLLYQNTLDKLLRFRNSLRYSPYCSFPLDLTLTSGDECDHHNTGFCAHTKGYKVDLSQDTPCLGPSIRSYTPVGYRGDGAEVWKDAENNVCFADEQRGMPHWDVTFSDLPNVDCKAPKCDGTKGKKAEI